MSRGDHRQKYASMGCCILHEGTHEICVYLLFLMPLVYWGALPDVNRWCFLFQWLKNCDYRLYIPREAYVSLRRWTTSGYFQRSVGACCWPEGKQLCWRTWIMSEFTCFPGKLQLGRRGGRQYLFHCNALQKCLLAFELHHFTWKKPQVKKRSPRCVKVKKKKPPLIYFHLGKEGIGGEGMKR